LKALEQGIAAGHSHRLLTPRHFHETEPVIIVGTGPAGMRAAQELLTAVPEQPVRLFGEEPCPPYNRVQLSALLAGRTTLDALRLRVAHSGPGRVEEICGRRVTAIDRRRRQIVDDEGYRHGYHRLVLATGSRPLLPLVPGMELDGVHTFRDLADARRLAERRGARNVVVLGGGLLGLEAARGLVTEGSAVTVVEAGERLMHRQLDARAANCLLEEVRAVGVTVRLGLGVSAVEGRRHVEYVRLVGGERLPCDVLVVAAGIVPNVDLAEASGLAVARGIRVNDRMQTSDPFIHAVGECAEHDGRLYGLAGPGLEQARTAALALAGERPRYRGSCSATRLKLFDRAVFSVGRVTEEEVLPGDRAHIFIRERDGVYRKVVTRCGRLIGALGFGQWDDAALLPDAVRDHRRIWPWQMWRFRRTGRLFGSSGGSIGSWPPETKVCNCAGVDKARLAAARDGGADDVHKLTMVTGAGSVCGSCTPLLSELLGQPAAAPSSGRRPLLGLSALALLAVAALVLLRPIPTAVSAQSGLHLQALWEDDFYKQISGFSMLALAALALLLSARKRLGRLRWGAFSAWRVFHLATGAAVLAMLLVHTGLSLGNNLNRLLTFDFLALSGAGAAAGTMFAFARPMRTKTRRWSVWIHLLLGWPLPVLLAFHILSVYYF